jgi:hypothetical protein
MSGGHFNYKNSKRKPKCFSVGMNFEIIFQRTLHFDVE